MDRTNSLAEAGPTLRSRLETVAFVATLRAAERLLGEAGELLKPEGLSHSQYNALRILRGAEPAGLKCGDIGARLITRDPDITRLLDRLESRGLVRRQRDNQDRRIILARITPAGLDLLSRLDTPVAELHRRQFSQLDDQALEGLVRLLTTAQSRAE